MVTVVADRYRLLNRLGAGGMSVVWRAHDDVLDRDVAVKILSSDLAADTDLLHRIRVEARSAARLRHPNVVEVHDYGETDEGLPYVVMELVDGRSLAQVLAEGALPWRSAALVCSQVADALAAAHARGIVHRDVKPSNVMVTPESVKLVDFGISATVGEADGVGGEVYGTPAYLAPERLAGGRVRPATDVYALGLLLYMSLAGRMPWRASTTTQMLRAHRYLHPSALPPVEGLPYELADLCHQCLAKDPADRPSAAAAASVLADAAGVTPAASLLTMLDAPTEELRTRGRHRPLIAASAIAFLLLVTGIGWFGSRDRPRDVEALTAVLPAATLECTVGYTVRSALNGKLSTAVIITNTGRSTASDWRLTFDLPDGQACPGLEHGLGANRSRDAVQGCRPAGRGQAGDRLRRELHGRHHAAGRVSRQRHDLPVTAVGRRPDHGARHHSGDHAGQARANGWTARCRQGRQQRQGQQQQRQGQREGQGQGQGQEGQGLNVTPGLGAKPPAPNGPTT